MLTDAESYIEIMLDGTHTDMHGGSYSFGEKEARQIVESFNLERFKPPIVLTHRPSTADTRYSEVADDDWWQKLSFGVPKRLARVGDRVRAYFDRVSPDLKKWWDDGQVTGFSASFYPPEHGQNPSPGKWCLRHIAALGSEPPAIKGLQHKIDYSELSQTSGNWVLDFGEADLPGDNGFASFRLNTTADFGAALPIADAIANLRDFLIDQFGLPVADRVIPGHLVMYLNDEAKSDAHLADDAALLAAYQEAQQLEQHIAFSDRESKEMSKTASFDMSEHPIVQQLSKEIADLHAERRREKLTAFCEQLEGNGQLLPAQRQPMAVSFGETAEEMDLLSFMESLNPSQEAFFQGWMSQLPKAINYQEVAKSQDRAKGDPGDINSVAGQEEVLKRAMSYCESNNLPTDSANITKAIVAVMEAA